LRFAGRGLAAVALPRRGREHAARVRLTTNSEVRVISDIQPAAFARTPKSRARWAPLAFITKSWNELTPEDGAVNAAISWSTSDWRVTVAVVISSPALVEGARPLPIRN
jgi:hypothetical protein